MVGSEDLVARARTRTSCPGKAIARKALFQLEETKKGAKRTASFERCVGGIRRQFLAFTEFELDFLLSSQHRQGHRKQRRRAVKSACFSFFFLVAFGMISVTSEKLKKHEM